MKDNTNHRINCLLWLEDRFYYEWLEFTEDILLLWQHRYQKNATDNYIVNELYNIRHEARLHLHRFTASTWQHDILNPDFKDTTAGTYLNQNPIWTPITYHSLFHLNI